MPLAPSRHRLCRYRKNDSMQKYFAMDFAFHNSMGVYSFEDRCEITRSAGYDGIHVTIWDGRNWAQGLQLARVKNGSASRLLVFTSSSICSSGSAMRATRVFCR